LRPIAKTFKVEDYPDLLVGLESPDDAAIWKLDEHRALVATADFFTPVVDDGYDYGAIAAANALSDIYAMGGSPFMALNLAALPPDLPDEISTAILRGGAEKAREAGVVIAGGHTIQDKEPKYGLSVIGFVDPQEMITKRGAKVGDLLVLTKPLGFGVTTTALKRQMASEEDGAEVTSWMKRLNDRSSAVALACGVRCGTDVTGFSLLGHGLELADASAVQLTINFDRLPFVSCATKYAGQWTFPGGASDNKLFFGKKVHFAHTISEAEQMLLFDPQTSGGLLLVVPASRRQDFQEKAARLELPFWVVGAVTDGRGIDVV
jgi:selenide, water dikinase